MEFDKEVDARGLNCPLPVLRLKKALSEVSARRIVRVLATDPSSVKDFEAFTRQTGHELLQQTEMPDSTYEFFIRHK
ncbi:MAG: sulfurtransferase TusA family protein [Proteobacteria bacterium]|jgi:tRNA 2-thiouridine synthesizing protein A|nr:sulfurtransferase TusA family protein [Pseudomonadota bacterium]